MKIIQQLRAQASIFQKDGDLQRPSTREELEAQNRWLPWKEVVRAVSVKRQCFQFTIPMNAKARECCDLVILSLYVFNCLSHHRGALKSELFKLSEPGSMDVRDLRGCNALMLRVLALNLL